MVGEKAENKNKSGFVAKVVLLFIGNIITK